MQIYINHNPHGTATYSGSVESMPGKEELRVLAFCSFKVKKRTCFNSASSGNDEKRQQNT